VVQRDRRLVDLMAPECAGGSMIAEPDEDEEDIEPCPDCGLDQKDSTLHVGGCPRIGTPAQFGPPWVALTDWSDYWPKAEPGGAA
jgi:hypothetical protein